MNQLEIVRLVAGRELRERGLTPTYLIVGVALPVIAAALLVFGALAFGEDIAAELGETSAPGSEDDRTPAELGLALGIVAFPLMLASALASGHLAGGIIEEKSSRVIEVLLATIQPRQLLVGKMLGIGLLVLMPVALLTAGVVAAVLSPDLHPLLPGLTAGALPLLALWVLLGYSFFVVISAALASLASRPEENTWHVLAIILLVLGFQAGSNVASDPHSGLAAVTSYLPFTAPFVVPTRVLAGSISVWGHLAAVALMVVLTAAATRVAVRIYSGAILHLRGRAAIGDAYRSAEL